MKDGEMRRLQHRVNVPLTRKDTAMATVLDKTLKRELRIGNHDYILALSPLALKLTLKGKRKGLELEWEALVSGDVALAAALNASIGELVPGPVGRKRPPRSSRNARPQQGRAASGSVGRGRQRGA
jgi:hypothetical protein